MPRHGVYISYSKWYTNESQDTLYANLRVFSDDLENALMYQQGNQQQIAFHSSEGYSIVETYLSRKIRLDLNGKPRELSLLSLETQQEALSIMLAIPIEKNTLSQVQLTNRLLLELFPSQLNIVQFRVGTETRYAKLDQEQVQVLWDF